MTISRPKAQPGDWGWEGEGLGQGWDIWVELWKREGSFPSQWKLGGGEGRTQD